MRVVLALTGNAPQSHGMALVRTTPKNREIGFHGGHNGGHNNAVGGNDQHPNDSRVGSGLHNPANDYQASGGRVFATFVNCALSLVDVPLVISLITVCPFGRSPALLPRLRDWPQCVFV
eukprot:SAG11_NODE_6065_length_1395_cov_1.732253_1_plen_119_part_00